MCKLTNKIDIVTAYGYKIVIKEHGKFYSPIMGIEYKEGPVEIPLVQKNSVETVSSDILIDRSERGCFEENMVGRTCIFLDKEVALDQLKSWKDYCDKKLVLVRIAVSGDLMVGNYGSYQHVIGGKNIVFIHECVDTK